MCDIQVWRTRLYSVLEPVGPPHNVAICFETPQKSAAVTVADVPAIPTSVKRRLRVVCLRMSVRYFDTDDASDEEDDIHESLVGEVCLVVRDADTLAKVRAELHRQLEPEQIPVKFHFVKSHHDDSASSEQDLLWIETIPWHLETKTLLSDCVKPNSNTILLTAPVSITKPFRVNGNESDADVRAQWNREKQALIMEIRALEARLAEARHQEDISPNSSLLKRALLALKRDGFIAPECNVDELEVDYLKVFSQHDAETLFNADESNPLRFVWRRMAGDPRAMRTYLEALQSVLIKYHVRRQRLSSRFWTRVLRDMRFVTDPSLFSSWAEKLPWEVDETERGAYLASLVLADTFGLDEYLLMQDGVPGSDLIRGENKAHQQSLITEDAPLQPIPRKRVDTIASAAERLHLRAVAKHERRMSSVDDDDSAASLLRVNVPADHPCDHFQVDMLAAQFGICVCGFSRQSHTMFESSKQLEAENDHGFEQKSPLVVGAGLNPCKNFTRDLSASRFGTCVCGFSKEDHLASESYEDERPILLKFGRNNHAEKQQIVRPRVHTEFPCDSYLLDIGAPQYGTCLCGHGKSAHVGAVRSDESSMGEEDERSLVQQQLGQMEMDEKQVTSKVRAQNAVRWVEGEISRLLRRIELLGKRNPDTGNYEITFGELFARYQDISDTLVGILVRAKRRKILDYHSGLGDMLLQGRHNAVKIILHRDQAETWRRARDASTTMTTGGDVLVVGASTKQEEKVAGA